jgi:hypothetical protein
MEPRPSHGSPEKPQGLGIGTELGSELHGSLTDGAFGCAGEGLVIDDYMALTSLEEKVDLPLDTAAPGGARNEGSHGDLVMPYGTGPPRFYEGP